MPLVTIWRDPKRADDAATVKIRDSAHKAVAAHLKMNMDDVALRVHEVGPLDKNYSIISIEIDTGPGKSDCRQKAKAKLAKAISADIVADGVIPDEWIGPLKSDLWLRILGGSAFLPIGRPDLAH